MSWNFFGPSPFKRGVFKCSLRFLEVFWGARICWSAVNNSLHFSLRIYLFSDLCDPSHSFYPLWRSGRDRHRTCKLFQKDPLCGGCVWDLVQKLTKLKIWWGFYKKVSLDSFKYLPDVGIILFIVANLRPYKGLFTLFPLLVRLFELGFVEFIHRSESCSSVEEIKLFIIFLAFIQILLNFIQVFAAALEFFCMFR